MSRYTSKHTGKKIDDTIDNVVNPNLLDNWYFGNPINQRGQTEYTAAGYTIDRWQFGSDADVKCVSVESGGVKISGSGGTYSNFEQILERLQAGTYTISFLVDDFKNVNQVYCPKANASNFTFYSNIVSLTFTLNADCEYIFMGIQKKIASNALTVIAAKLELGSQQTLAHQDANGNWVLNEIPDYGERLRRCQRYYLGDMQRDAPGRISGEHTAYCIVPIPVTMRQSSATTIQVFSVFGVIVDKDGAIHAVNNASCVVEADSYLLFSVSSADTMPLGPCIWQDAHFSISKDL